MDLLFLLSQSPGATFLTKRASNDATDGATIGAKDDAINETTKGAQNGTFNGAKNGLDDQQLSQPPSRSRPVIRRRRLSDQDVQRRKSLEQIKASVCITYCEVFGPSRRRGVSQIMNYSQGWH